MARLQATGAASPRPYPERMGDSIRQTVPLGPQWATVDPFLFCVHHLDVYPAGNDALGPDASLAGRDIGMDFAGIDGWRMYHGATVPGFPQHPHRGFETVTFVRRGVIDHSDSLGATARFGRGDVQWLTAGKGIVHCEMFPLLDRERENVTELFQIWLNLPASHKMVEPYFTMLWDQDLPRHAVADADLAIWHLVLEPGARFDLPVAKTPETVRTLYVFEGSVRIDEQELEAATGAVLRVDADVEVTAGPNGAEALVLQGRPIGEPVAQYGPFVMNDEAGVRQAFADYRATEFGGWPWSVDDPVHPRAEGRFARRPDGTVDRPRENA